MEIKTPTKEEKIAFHLKGIKMVLIAAIFGILAGTLSSPFFISQPQYTTLAQAGPSVLQNYPSVLLTNVSTVEANATVLAWSPSGTVTDPALLPGNVSAIEANRYVLWNNSTRSAGGALISTGGAAVTAVNSTILVSGPSITSTNEAVTQTNASAVLNTGLIVKPSGAASPVLVLTNETTMWLNPGVSNHSPIAILILALAIYVQKYVFPLVKVKSSEFDFKAWFFLSFITLCFWYITWSILLNPIGVPVGQIYHYPFGPFF